MGNYLSKNASEVLSFKEMLDNISMEDAVRLLRHYAADFNCHDCEKSTCTTCQYGQAKEKVLKAAEEYDDLLFTCYLLACTVEHLQAEAFIKTREPLENRMKIEPAPKPIPAKQIFEDCLVRARGVRRDEMKYLSESFSIQDAFGDLRHQGSDWKKYIWRK